MIEDEAFEPRTRRRVEGAFDGGGLEEFEEHGIADAPVGDERFGALGDEPEAGVGESADGVGLGVFERVDHLLVPRVAGGVFLLGDEREFALVAHDAEVFADGEDEGAHEEGEPGEEAAPAGELGGESVSAGGRGGWGMIGRLFHVEHHRRFCARACRKWGGFGELDVGGRSPGVPGN